MTALPVIKRPRRVRKSDIAPTAGATAAAEIEYAIPSHRYVSSPPISATIYAEVSQGRKMRIRREDVIKRTGVIATTNDMLILKRVINLGMSVEAEGGASATGAGFTAAAFSKSMVVGVDLPLCEEGRMSGPKLVAKDAISLSIGLTRVSSWTNSGSAIRKTNGKSLTLRSRRDALYAGGSRRLDGSHGRGWEMSSNLNRTSTAAGPSRLNGDVGCHGAISHDSIADPLSVSSICKR